MDYKCDTLSKRGPYDISLTEPELLAQEATTNLRRRYSTAYNLWLELSHGTSMPNLTLSADYKCDTLSKRGPYDISLTEPELLAQEATTNLPQAKLYCMQFVA
ncbi:hypothetical protein J6590_071261 [Homalodisca vitripennis]|nr:hypothetical protein J6590_071261 [Homalodisca vitripennis]